MARREYRVRRTRPPGPREARRCHPRRPRSVRRAETVKPDSMESTPDGVFCCERIQFESPTSARIRTAFYGGDPLLSAWLGERRTYRRLSALVRLLARA